MSLSTKSFAAIQKAFTREAEQNFDFLVRDFGFTGPEKSDSIVQEVSYHKLGLCLRISFDHDEMSILTQVETRAGDVTLVAELGELASAAGIPEGKKVRGTVHSLKNLQKVLNDYAALARIIQPRLSPDATVDLMTRAGARQWHNN